MSHTKIAPPSESAEILRTIADDLTLRCSVEAASWLTGVVLHPEIGRLSHYVELDSYVVREGLLDWGWQPTAEAPLVLSSPLETKTQLIVRPLLMVAHRIGGVSAGGQLSVIHSITDDYLGEEPFGPYDQASQVLPDDETLVDTLAVLAHTRRQEPSCPPLSKWIAKHS